MSMARAYKETLMTAGRAVARRIARAASVALALLRRHPRRALAAAAALLVLGAGYRLLRPSVDPALTAVVRRGELTVETSVGGILKPASSITYRSPLAGRDLEVVFLAPEGLIVNEGDLVARLDTGDLEADLLRAVQDARQAEVELRVAEVERQEVLGQLDSLKQGEGALGLAETEAGLKRQERAVARLKQEYEGLRPLVEKGFVTRDEVERSAAELEQAEAELALARRKAEVQLSRTRPREEQRAHLQLAQKEAQIENARARVRETAGRVVQLRGAIGGCSLYARAAGLVVYEEFLSSSPRRKIRVGDRVTASQGLVTIPEVQKMVVEASVAEGEVHRVAPGQPAVVRLDAFPGLVLAGRVGRVGTLARASAERPWEEKRFDLIIELDPATAALRPEMTARADIRVGELKDVLLLPVNAVFERQGRYVCHVVRLLGVDSREVTLGEASDQFVVVRDGLREGERVALTDVAGEVRGRPAPAAERPLQLKGLAGSDGGSPRLAPR